MPISNYLVLSYLIATVLNTPLKYIYLLFNRINIGFNKGGCNDFVDIFNSFFNSLAMPFGLVLISQFQSFVNAWKDCQTVLKLKKELHLYQVCIWNIDLALMKISTFCQNSILLLKVSFSFFHGQNKIIVSVLCVMKELKFD